MKIIVAPDSFKGTLTAPEAASAIRDGVMDVMPETEVLTLPLGDGGEGTADAIAGAMKQRCRSLTCKTVDPLRREITAKYYILDNKTALIESASASGLTLLRYDERDVWKADTYGTGLLIADAVRRGIKDFVICMGGTATCDGGFGAFQALHDTGCIEGSEACKLQFTLLCDVENPLTGPAGAAEVFGPQKGATPEMIPLLDSRLQERAVIYKSIRGIDVRGMKYAGAAGGLSGMLMACFGAKPVAGILEVLRITEFDKMLKGAHLVITGEGKADATTLSGKVALGVLDAARKHGVAVALIAGKVSDAALLKGAGFEFVEQATPDDRDPAVSYREYLSKAAARLISSF